MFKLILVLVSILYIIKNFGQNISTPQNYAIVDTVLGDLDKDGINELVVAYDTQIIKKNSFVSIPRELFIYKIKNNKWTLWKKSKQVLLGSDDGGASGDPFGQMEIKNGILLVSHGGGSSWKWGYTDKYRFQNGKFYLIGYSSIVGKLCEYWLNIDFNLLTGKIIIKKEFEKCGDGKQNFYKSENEIFVTTQQGSPLD